MNQETFEKKLLRVLKVWKDKCHDEEMTTETSADFNFCAGKANAFADLAHTVKTVGFDQVYKDALDGRQSNLPF